MTASGARRTDASGTDERPEPSARPARAGLPDPFRFLFAARLPRLGVRGGLAAALVLLALAALVPAGPAQAQVTGLKAYPTVGGIVVSWTSGDRGMCSGSRAWAEPSVLADRNAHNQGANQEYFTGNSYTITGLTPGTVYTVRVRTPC